MASTGAVAGYTYGYDQLNRLMKMNRHTPGGGTWNNTSIIDAYKEQISYDANGNILTYLRNGQSNNLLIDNLSYKYKEGTNQLDHADDAVAASNYSTDIDDQDTLNYRYDKIGNLKKDIAEGMDTIRWTVYGKINKIVKGAASTNISYNYDASGNKTVKEIAAHDTLTKTFYVRDAQGNVMAVYKKDAGNLKWSEQHLYGSSRLGMLRIDSLIPANPPNAGETGVYDELLYGTRNYELTNHLGNVLATISDKKIGHAINDTTIDYFKADVVSANDYYPGGMTMPGRAYSQSTNGYRYGFNTQEKSDEISGEGNHTTALYGEYDTRLGRRWNPDPRPTVGISDYSTFFNNPIWRNDILLDTPTTKQAALMSQNSYSKFDPKNPVQAKLKEMGWNREEKIKTNLFGKSNQEVSLDDIGSATGYNMALYSRTLNGKTEWSLANTGTNDLIDVGSDARNLTGSSDQFAFSLRFAKSLQNGMGGQEMTYVGHSLGGSLAAANSLATGNAAITFNPAGVSWGTRMANNLPKDKRNGQIQSFVVGGEAVDRSQRLVGSRANGQVSYIHPQYGSISSGTALLLRFSTDIITSVQYHSIETVIKSLDKAGIK